MHGDGSERWRLPGDGPGEGEVRISGSRVVAPGGHAEVVVPWSEELRYTTARRRGYHGGITPQEALPPLLVACPPGQWPKGRIPLDRQPPEWWRRPPAADQPGLPEAQVAEPRPAPGETFELFALAPEGPPAGPEAALAWALVGSDLYREQRRRVRRRPPRDEDVRQVVELLLERGGRAAIAAVAAALRKPEATAWGFAATLSQVLNVDGFPVLALDRSEGTLGLDRELLRGQFGLDG